MSVVSIDFAMVAYVEPRISFESNRGWVIEKSFDFFVPGGYSNFEAFLWGIHWNDVINI